MDSRQLGRDQLQSLRLRRQPHLLRNHIEVSSGVKYIECIRHGQLSVVGDRVADQSIAPVVSLDQNERTSLYDSCGCVKPKAPSCTYLAFALNLFPRFVGCGMDSSGAVSAGGKVRATSKAVSRGGSYIRFPSVGPFSGQRWYLQSTQPGLPFWWIVGDDCPASNNRDGTGGEQYEAEKEKASVNDRWKVDFRERKISLEI
jgi:hypothetical protein